MAEPGAVSGILGSEGASPAEGTAPETPSPLDPTAAALAAEVARSNPELAQEASTYFRKQSHLVEVQTEHLHEQRAVNLQLLKLRRFDERLRVGLRLFVILVATVIGIFGAVFIHDAVTSRNVIIEPFDVSPSLAAQSLSGKMVAARILDELNRLQTATQGSAQKTSITSAWDSDIKIEVAETGLSIGEISRRLRERFGHDVRIGGDLVELPMQGVALTVRGTGVLPKTFNGSAAELPKLIRAGAEYLYAQSQPALWAAYLASTGRADEAIVFARSAIFRTNPVDRARVYDAWANAVANSGGSLREALSLARESVKLNPTDWGAHNDVQQFLVDLGDEEGACRAGEAMQKLAGGRPGKAPEVQYQIWDLLTGNILAATRALVADLDATGGLGTNYGPQWPYLAWMQALMHDPDGAQFIISSAREDRTDEIWPVVLRQMKGTLATELGDAAGAAQEWEALARKYKPETANVAGNAICYLAPALERTGRHADADAALDAVGKLTFVDCYRFRGDILESRGDWAGAQDWYARAVKLGPSLPAGYFSWGLALAKHGDLEGAAAKLKDANQKGPHWADPLKAWGDVLMKQGKIKEALAKYDEALKYAPNWKQLQEAREVLAKQRN